MWGHLAKVDIPEFKKTKVGPKTLNAIFVGYSNQKPISTLLIQVSILQNNLGVLVNQLIIGSLLYVVNRTKFDNAYAIGRLSKYIQSPNQPH